MSPPLDICCAVSPFTITYRYLLDPETESCCAEEQVEVAERIKVAKKTSMGSDLVIIFFGHDFGPAKSILESLAEDKREGKCKKFVAYHVDESHCLFIHRIYQPAAINELALVPYDRIVK